MWGKSASRDKTAFRAKPLKRSTSLLALCRNSARYAGIDGPANSCSYGSITTAQRAGAGYPHSASGSPSTRSTSASCTAVSSAR